MSSIAHLLQEKEIALHRVKREVDALRLAAALLAEPTDAPARQAQSSPAFHAADTQSGKALDSIRGATAGRTAFAASFRGRIFPEPRDGVIICDACGHASPDYLLDCEKCDIPIRLRS